MLFYDAYNSISHIPLKARSGKTSTLEKFQRFLDCFVKLLQTILTTFVFCVKGRFLESLLMYTTVTNSKP
jgi:hypothetical protein